MEQKQNNRMLAVAVLLLLAAFAILGLEAGLAALWK
jgi:hypothetical protein